MAGKRMLHSNICESDKLSAVSFQAESLYYRLLTRVDDNGNFTANPKIVLGQCMPLRENIQTKDISAWLGELANCGNGKPPLIQFYEENGDKFIHITKFEDFQYLRPDRFAAAKFPPHPSQLWPDNGKASPAAVSHCQDNAMPLAENDGRSKERLSIKLSKERLSTTEPPQGGQVNFKFMRTHYYKFLEIIPISRKQDEEEYQKVCSQSGGEDVVLAYFDEWASERSDRLKKNKFALKFFYNDLPDMIAGAGSRPQIADSGPPEDLEAIKTAAIAAIQAQNLSEVEEIKRRQNDPNRYEI